jgi:predicted nucleic acid-binding protein
MKVLADTNVILDAIAAREPFRENAKKIVLLIAEEK